MKSVVLVSSKMVKKGLTPNEQRVALIERAGELLEDDQKRAMSKYFQRVQSALAATMEGEAEPLMPTPAPEASDSVGADVASVAG